MAGRQRSEAGYRLFGECSRRCCACGPAAASARRSEPCENLGGSVRKTERITGCNRESYKSSAFGIVCLKEEPEGRSILKVRIKNSGCLRMSSVLHRAHSFSFGRNPSIVPAGNAFVQFLHKRLRVRLCVPASACPPLRTRLRVPAFARELL